MTRRILLPGAGTGAANNLIRSLWADYPGLVVVGANDDRFTLRNSKANRNYLLPAADDPRFADALRTLVERERIDLLMPNSAADVGIASGLRDVLPCRTLLPSKSCIDRCLNPQELREFLRGQGILAVFADPPRRGRDIACQSLWKDGRLILIKTVERLAYLDATTRTGGTIESLARTVNEPKVVATCVEAIRAIDPAATGAFSVNLTESPTGRPCITEVSPGHFTTMVNFFDFTGRHNMSAAYVRLALGEPVDIDDPCDVAEDRFFVRGIDTLPAIFHPDQLFEGIAEVARAS
jgi:hypothetical protein